MTLTLARLRRGQRVEMEVEVHGAVEVEIEVEIEVDGADEADDIVEVEVDAAIDVLEDLPALSSSPMVHLSSRLTSSSSSRSRLSMTTGALSRG